MFLNSLEHWINNVHELVDLAIIKRSDVILSTQKFEVQKYLLGKSLAKHFNLESHCQFDIYGSQNWKPVNWFVLGIVWLVSI